jgi:hypothetical protein
MGFEPTISVLERAKTVRALDRAATVIGLMIHEDECGRVDGMRICKGNQSVLPSSFSVDPVLDPPLVRESSPDLWICSQELPGRK